MKKTLVAAAALVSVSAFAQVTITGNLDFAGSNLSGSQTGAKGQTVSTTIGVSSTSVINLDAIEDIGGGTKVQVHYGLDPRTLANDSFAVSNNQVSATSGATTSTVLNYPTGLGRDETYIAFDSDAVGKLMVGAPNALGIDTNGVSSALGTGVGSGYGSSAMTNAIVKTRYDRSVRFNSAAMNGLSFQVVYAPGSDNAGGVTSYTAPGSGVVLLAQQIPNARKATEVGLSYSNGPLNARFTNIAQYAQTNPTGWYAANGDGTQTAINLVATKANLLAANYNLGATTLYFGVSNGDLMTSTTSATKVNQVRYSVKYDTGVFAVIGQLTTQRETTGAGVVTDRKVNGLRADYPLSKTSKVYAGYEYWNTGKLAAVTDTTTGDRKITSIGLQKSF